ncbi:MAG: ABC transporter ATP-binding protein, partial [Bacteroidaceae bacterium]|nr:ABC transporter ATP-binding protein [Bacteroidaceae bacterium]
MKNLKRIYRLLLKEERRKALKMIVTVFFSSLLDFAGLAALLPVLYFLLDEGGERSKTAAFFCLLALVVILLKCVLGTFFTHYQHRCLLSFYKRLSFSLFSSYYDRGLLFIREHGSNKLGYQINAMCYA